MDTGADIENDGLSFDHLCITPNEVQYVIYHGNCSDGFTAALAAYKYFERRQATATATAAAPGDAAAVPMSMPSMPQFHAGRFNVLPPLTEVQNKCVLIVDFSYKKPDMAKLMSVAKKVVVLDHHKTAQEDLKDLPAPHKVFCMDHSGAYLSWRFFFRDQPLSAMPLMVRYVEDNDMWWKRLPHTLKFTAFMFTLPFTFEDYGRLLSDEGVRDAIAQGQGMVKQNASILNSSIKYAAPKFIQIGDRYYMATFLNATTLKSELGNRAFVEYPHIDFAAVYSHNDYNNTTSFSLRSIETAADVSEIAKSFGGGGHRCASACLVRAITNCLPVEELDGHKSYFVLQNIYPGAVNLSAADDDDHKPESKSTATPLCCRCPASAVMLEDPSALHQSPPPSPPSYSAYHTVYLNSAHYKHDLAKYLLQTKYISKSGEPVQQCVALFRKTRKEKTKVVQSTGLHGGKPVPLTTKYDLAAVWNYDGTSDCTWFTICWTDLSFKFKLAGLETHKGVKDFKITDDRCVFSLDGFHSKLPF